MTQVLFSDVVVVCCSLKGEERKQSDITHETEGSAHTYVRTYVMYKEEDKRRASILLLDQCVTGKKEKKGQQ